MKSYAAIVFIAVFAMFYVTEAGPVVELESDESHGQVYHPCDNDVDFNEENAAQPIVLLNESCVLAFFKGPCKQGEWVVFKNDSNKTKGIRSGVCEARTCPPNNKEDEAAKPPIIWVTEPNGKCIQINTPNLEFCGNITLTVLFTIIDHHPWCSTKFPEILLEQPSDVKGRGLATWLGRLLGRTTKYDSHKNSRNG